MVPYLPLFLEFLAVLLGKHSYFYGHSWHGLSLLISQIHGGAQLYLTFQLDDFLSNSGCTLKKSTFLKDFVRKTYVCFYPLSILD